MLQLSGYAQYERRADVKPGPRPVDAAATTGALLPLSLKDASQPSKAFFWKNLEDSDELLITRRENLFPKGRGHSFTKLDFILGEIHAPDDSAGAECLIKRQHKTGFERCATCLARGD